MEKKTNKYSSGDIQNECLQVMALQILASAQILQRMDLFQSWQMSAQNNEQFVICIRWVDNTLTDHEDVIRLHKVDTMIPIHWLQP